MKSYLHYVNILQAIPHRRTAVEEPGFIIPRIVA